MLLLIIVLITLFGLARGVVVVIPVELLIGILV